MNSVSQRTYVLAPSAFSFLWEECTCCYYLQVVQQFRRPNGPFPSIFGKIDLAMKRRFAGDQWHSFGPSQPNFKIAHDEQMIRSTPITLPGRSVAIVLRGKFDSVLHFRDGRIVVCDFKTTSVKSEYIAKYWVQLHSCAYALEHPAVGSLSIPRVDALGLAAFEPEAFAYDGEDGAALSGALRWIDMSRDDARFMRFLDEIVAVLEQPEPPAPSANCQYCRYRFVA
jgi:hypothetical protein